MSPRALLRLVVQLRARPHVERWRWWGLWVAHGIVVAERASEPGDGSPLAPWGRA